MLQGCRVCRVWGILMATRKAYCFPEIAGAVWDGFIRTTGSFDTWEGTFGMFWITAKECGLDHEITLYLRATSGPDWFLAAESQEGWDGAYESLLIEMQDWVDGKSQWKDVSERPELLIGTVFGTCDKKPCEREAGHTGPCVSFPEHLEATKMTEATKNNCELCDGTEWVCEAHETHPSDTVSMRSDACGDGPGVPCPACNNSMRGEKAQVDEAAARAAAAIANAREQSGTVRGRTEHVASLDNAAFEVTGSTPATPEGVCDECSGDGVVEFDNGGGLQATACGMCDGSGGDDPDAVAKFRAFSDQYRQSLGGTTATDPLDVLTSLEPCARRFWHEYVEPPPGRPRYRPTVDGPSLSLVLKCVGSVPDMQKKCGKPADYIEKSDGLYRCRYCARDGLRLDGFEYLSGLLMPLDRAIADGMPGRISGITRGTPITAWFGIGRHPLAGWFLMASAGNEPVMVWAEWDPSNLDREDEARDKARFDACSNGHGGGCECPEADHNKREQENRTLLRIEIPGKNDTQLNCHPMGRKVEIEVMGPASKIVLSHGQFRDLHQAFGEWLGLAEVEPYAELLRILGDEVVELRCASGHIYRHVRLSSLLNDTTCDVCPEQDNDRLSISVARLAGARPTTSNAAPVPTAASVAEFLNVRGVLFTVCDDGKITFAGGAIVDEPLHGLSWAFGDPEVKGTRFRALGSVFVLETCFRQWLSRVSRLPAKRKRDAGKLLRLSFGDTVHVLGCDFNDSTVDVAASLFAGGKEEISISIPLDRGRVSDLAGGLNEWLGEPSVVSRLRDALGAAVAGREWLLGTDLDGLLQIVTDNHKKLSEPSTTQAAPQGCVRNGSHWKRSPSKVVGVLSSSIRQVELAEEVPNEAVGATNRRPVSVVFEAEVVLLHGVFTLELYKTPAKGIEPEYEETVRGRFLSFAEADAFVDHHQHRPATEFGCGACGGTGGWQPEIALDGTDWNHSDEVENWASTSIDEGVCATCNGKGEFLIMDLEVRAAPGRSVYRAGQLEAGGW